MLSRPPFRALLQCRTLWLVGAVSAALLAGCDKSAPATPPAQGPTEVGVVTIGASDAALMADLPGRTAAFRLAEVRPQVSGIIDKRLFTEGAEIKAGTRLYQIDAATYQAALTTAEAELARADANLAAAKAREARYKNLVGAKAISRQDYDDALATLGQSKAAVAAGKAAVQSAQINLRYTEVIAPISGVIGKSAVTEGALVSAGQAQVLASIQQLDPIYVDVSQSVNDLLALRRQLKAGTVAQADSATVRLVLDDGSVYEHEGKLQFSEVSVNETTGTVVLRAVFPNPERMLLPGMFVRTQLEEGVHGNAILVPQRAVTRDRSGNATALVVNNGAVELRALSVSRAVGNSWLVDEGLAVGDQVILEGLQRIRPGALVTAVPAQFGASDEPSKQTNEPTKQSDAAKAKE